MTSVLPLMTLAYARRALGDGAVAEVLAAAGVAADDPSLANDEQWMPASRAIAIAEAAAAVCADPEIGRRVGEEYFRAHEAEGVVDWLRGAGTPAAALGLAASFATKMSSSRRFEVVSTADTEVVVESHFGDAAGRHRFWCQVAAGYWALVPGLFGAAGVAVEPRCELLGHACCRFVIRWDRPVSVVGDETCEGSRRRADGTVARFEDLQAMAAELALAEDVPTVLDRIVRRISTAVMAPRFLLTVRQDDTSPAEVYSVGFGRAEAEDASAAVWHAAPDDRYGTPLVVEVATPRCHYGYLAAYFPSGARISDVERRLLRAYAGHATAALEQAVGLAMARRNHQTAAALLALARSLAAASSVAEVCRRVTEAIPEVVGCDLAGIWLWDPSRDRLLLQSWTDGWSVTGPTEIAAADLVLLRELVDHPKALTITAGPACPVLRDVLEAWGVREVAVAPILLRGDLAGLLAASSREPLAAGPERATVVDRLGALADQAATAIENSRLVEQIRHQALHDALTGLPNRPLVEDRAEQALAAAARGDRGVGLLFVDLDRFKNVNDTLGHSAGDELIRQVAERLTGCVRAADTVARLGGDEFLVLASDLCAPADAVAVADKVIQAVRRPFVIAGQQLFVSSSVGIACHPEHGDDYETLMRHADAAMYEAKARGRNTYAVHAAEPPGRRHDRLRLESELHVALARQELAVVYQPQLDLRTARVVAAEALVRWDHPSLGRITPDAFLGMAEESGLIVEIDAWVREQALGQARRWLDAGMPLRVALNLSTRDLYNPDLAKDISRLMERAAVPAHLVELEVTDRVVMSGGDLPRVLSELKGMGVRLAIDDFGTGNSVLGRLRHCPVDAMKIDRSFITCLTEEGADARLVHALISMAHALGLEVVGEGIETATQAGILRRYGCEIGQGHLFSAPIDPAALTELVRGYAPNGDAGVGVRPAGRSPGPS